MSDIKSYAELLTEMDDAQLKRERNEEQNKFLAENVELFNAIQEQHPQETVEAIKAELKKTIENLHAIEGEIERRDPYAGFETEPTPEQMTQALNEVKKQAMAALISLGQDITEMLSTAMSLMLRLASDLPTEDRYEPLTQERAVIEQAKKAASLLQKAWEEAQGAVRLVERALNSVELSRRALIGEIALSEGKENPYKDEIPF